MKMIGSINCYLECPCHVKGKRITFDGTIKDMVRVAVEMGAKAGDKIAADFGSGFQDYKLYAAPHDDRAYGFWAQRAK